MGIYWECFGNEKAFIVENIPFLQVILFFNGNVLGQSRECLGTKMGTK